MITRRHILSCAEYDRLKIAKTSATTICLPVCRQSETCTARAGKGVLEIDLNFGVYSTNGGYIAFNLINISCAYARDFNLVP